MSDIKLKTVSRGVKYHDRNKKWEARIMINGQRITLGYFDRVEDAEAAYKRAKEAKTNSSLRFLCQ